MLLQITEILGPSPQGQARPYQCRAEDGHLYYVKGRQTNRASLWHEWICGHLAQQCGLPVPPFSLVEVSPELLAEAPPEWREMGDGTAFGSQLHHTALWFEPSMVKDVPETVQRDVLVFDWWVRNGDRLTGNPNLLWDGSAKQLVVIDHNSAFDPDFSVDTFMKSHIFAKQWPVVCNDLVAQAQYSERLEAALQVLPAVRASAPPEWHWGNPEMDVPANFDWEAVQQTLARCTCSNFWRTV